MQCWWIFDFEADYTIKLFDARVLQIIALTTKIKMSDSENKSNKLSVRLDKTLHL
jgi:hypothetical protein